MPLKPAAKVPDEDDLFCVILGYLSRKSTRSCYRRLQEAGPEGRAAAIDDMRSKYGKGVTDAAEMVSGIAQQQEGDLHGGGPAEPEPIPAGGVPGTTREYPSPTGEFKTGETPRDCAHPMTHLGSETRPGGPRRVICDICGHVVGFGGVG